MAHPPPSETDALLHGREQNTFLSISLGSESRSSLNAIDNLVKAQHLERRRQKEERVARTRARHHRGILSMCCATRHAHSGCHVLRNMRMFVFVASVFMAIGIGFTAVAVIQPYSTDGYLFMGAIVSAAFTLAIICCYAMSRAVRAHPNPLILSKSLVDLLLAALYIAEYCVTELSTESVVLPFRIAAITQALLVAGEFWFFAIPIDMVQSITNPFTSYSHNFRVYWFYSVLSGTVCGFVLWFLGHADVECMKTGTNDGAKGVECPEAIDGNDQRFIWFHHNTDMPGFFWHQWILYHLCVLVYLVFGIACMLYVRRRLRRGLEETFDVRRLVLSNGMLTCAVYISWSFITLCLFALTNAMPVKDILGITAFTELINISAFLHSARGAVNIIVWLVVNAPYLLPLCFESDTTTASAAAPANLILSPSGASLMDSFASSDAGARKTMDKDSRYDDAELDGIMKPQLNEALQKQMIHMATSGIIESVQHYHRLRREIGSNHTFHLDWQRSPQRKIRQLQSSLSMREDVGSMTIPPRSMPSLRETRNSKIRVVEAQRDNPSNLGFTSFMPMTLTEMQFYDFQPRVFATIRQLYSVNDAEYVYAFRSTMNERISEGRSGAFVFNTCDRKYLVKSTTAEEKDVLLALLPSYLRYLKWNPGTLLPRFFGFHAMKMYGQIFYFIVMGNFLSTDEVIHRRYDIKGSWEDRNAPACVLGEKYRCSKCNRFFTFGGAPGEPCFSPGEEHYPDITLRDNDLKKRLKLEPATGSKLLKQLTRDSNFLASVGIMDYSLLIGTHYSYFTITTEHKGLSRRKSVELKVNCEDTHEKNKDAEFLHNLCEEPRTADEDDDMSEADQSSEFERSRTNRFSERSQRGSGVVYPESHVYHAHQVSGPSKYYFGLVDILQKWTLTKQMERAYKVRVLRKSRRGVSAIPPKPYALRFQRKMKQLFITNPSHPHDSFDDALDDAPVDLPAQQV